MKEQADHISLRLLMEGSVLGLVLGAWLWGILTLVLTRWSPSSFPPPMTNAFRDTWSRVPVRRAQRRGVGSVDSGDDGGWLQEVRSHMITSRQPGAGRTEQVHRGDT